MIDSSCSILSCKVSKGLTKISNAEEEEIIRKRDRVEFSLKRDRFQIY